MIHDKKKIKTQKNIALINAQLTYTQTHTFIYLVPPLKPKIWNERREAVHSLAGPYEEGSDMILSCDVRGGRPPPKITWLLNGRPVDSIMIESDFSFTSTQTSKLVIKNLSRMHQRATITCRASNFPKTEYATNTTLDLMCKYYFVIRFF